MAGEQEPRFDGSFENTTFGDFIVLGAAGAAIGVARTILKGISGARRLRSNLRPARVTTQPFEVPLYMSQAVEQPKPEPIIPPRHAFVSDPSSPEQVLLAREGEIIQQQTVGDEGELRQHGS